MTNVYCNAGGVRGKAALSVCAHRDSYEVTTPKQYAIVRDSLYNLHGHDKGPSRRAARFV